jgi:malate dehydrogenase
MTRDDLFNTNASIVRDLAKAAAESAPEANILVISNPVNSTVPIVAEIFKAKGVYNPKRLFGVTTLDVVRASRFVSEIKNTDPVDENITVIGGHSGVTIVPLFSQSSHPDLVGNAELLQRVQFGGDEVVKAKDGAGSATLSMAMAGARFAESLLKAAQGQKGVVEPTFVDSPLYKDEGIDFFASKVELGPNGVEKILDVGKLDAQEQKLLDACKEDLKKVNHSWQPNCYKTLTCSRTSRRVLFSSLRTQANKCPFPPYTSVQKTGTSFTHTRQLAHNRVKDLG